MNTVRRKPVRPIHIEGCQCDDDLPAKPYHGPARRLRDAARRGRLPGADGQPARQADAALGLAARSRGRVGLRRLSGLRGPIS